MGQIALNGRWSEGENPNTAILVVHGLGGSWDRPYCIRAARAASRLGWSCLRLALRGADRSGADFYHGGLYEDLVVALHSPELRDVQRVLLLGYSLGGHVVLRAAASGELPTNVVGAASICAPVQLDTAADHLDLSRTRLYRRHVMNGLQEIYAAFAARHSDWPAARELRGVDSIREWDDLTVARRYGFASAAAYYASESVAQRLAQLQIPTLFVGSREDPMIPYDTVEPYLATASSRLHVHWIDGAGHVGFPLSPKPRLGRGEGLESQVLGWLDTH
jgi:predicted alpha/beta-fold hydrolase